MAVSKENPIKKTEVSKFEKWTREHAAQITTLKNIVEIVALCIAAFWALYKVSAEELPPLEHEILSTQSISTYWMDTATVELIYNLSINNTSKGSFDVDSVKFKIWYLPFDSIKSFFYFNRAEYEQNNPCMDSLTDKNSLLCTHYPVSMTLGYDYAFYYPPNYYLSALFRYTIFGHYKFWGFSCPLSVNGDHLVERVYAY